MPRVSILLPAFNAASTLGAALRSIRRQTYADWECVVVDDGSRDTTAAIVRDTSLAEPRIRLLQQPHGGIVEALRLGLTHCRGTLIARMDADDLMHRERLARQVESLDRDASLAGVGSHVRLFPRAHLADGRRRYEAWLNSIVSSDDVRREAFVECPLAHPTLLLRRATLERHGYRDAGWAEDYDLVLRLLAAGERLAVVPQRLLAWRDHAMRLSRTGSAYSIDGFTRCKAAFLASGFLASTERYVLWGFGGTGKALRRALACHGRVPSHIVELHPRRIGERIQGAPVIAPDGLRQLTAQPIVVSVAGAEPRTEIRAWLNEAGFDEGRDFICAA